MLLVVPRNPQRKAISNAVLQKRYQFPEQATIMAFASQLPSRALEMYQTKIRVQIHVALEVRTEMCIRYLH